MKLLFFLLLFCLTLFSQEEDSATDAIDVIFLKIATEAFMSDYENEKNITRKNIEAIRALESAVRELNKKIDELKTQMGGEKVLSVRGGFVAQPQSMQSDTNSTDTQKLQYEIESIKSILSQMLTKSGTKKEAKLQGYSAIEREAKLELIAKSAEIRAEPNFRAKSVGELKKGESVDVAGCDKYGWCKLKNQEGYVARYLFNTISPVETESMEVE